MGMYTELVFACEMRPDTPKTRRSSRLTRHWLCLQKIGRQNEAINFAMAILREFNPIVPANPPFSTAKETSEPKPYLFDKEAFLDPDGDHGDETTVPFDALIANIALHPEEYRAGTHFFFHRQYGSPIYVRFGLLFCNLKEFGVAWFDFPKKLRFFRVFRKWKKRALLVGKPVVIGL